MRAANKNIDWPLPCDLTPEEHHKQMKKLLDAARHCINDNPSICTLSQLAARQGVSVRELRDDARKWTDTAPRMERLITELKARLLRLVLGKNGAISRAAVQLLGIELRERQLSSDNQTVTEGREFQVNIINYARPGKRRKFGDEDGNDAEYAG